MSGYDLYTSPVAPLLIALIGLEPCVLFDL